MNHFDRPQSIMICFHPHGAIDVRVALKDAPFKTEYSCSVEELKDLICHIIKRGY